MATEDRVLFAEWGDRYVTPLGGLVPRPACPICGHPTMDCTTHPIGEQ